MKTISISDKSERIGRVSRGGVWHYSMGFACEAHRARLAADDRHSIILGFRCCWSG